MSWIEWWMVSGELKIVGGYWSGYPKMYTGMTCLENFDWSFCICDYSSLSANGRVAFKLENCSAIGWKACRSLKMPITLYQHVYQYYWWMLSNANSRLLLFDKHYSDCHHNECNGISNHQRLDCWLSRFFSGADQGKHQISSSLAFVRANHQCPVVSLTKGQ